MLYILFAVAALAFIAIAVIGATIGITLTSLASLVTAPRQFWALLRNHRLRRNHALEHATINVIEERYGPTRLAGLAGPEGFTIRGGAAPELVASAAQEALRRMRAGERELAIHPRCGTTLVASQMVMGLTFIVVLLVMRQFTLWPFVLGILAAILLGPRLSPLLQRHITTDASVADLAIVGVERQTPGSQFGIASFFTAGPVFVRTAETASGDRVTIETVDGRVTVITGEHDEVAAGGYRVR